MSKTTAEFMAEMEAKYEAYRERQQSAAEKCICQLKSERDAARAQAARWQRLALLSIPVVVTILFWGAVAFWILR